MRTAATIDLQTHKRLLGLAASTDRYYDAHAVEYAARTMSADMSQFQDRFLRALPPGGKVLDVGCGAGRDLAVFRQRGFNAIGLDASPRLVEIAREHSAAPCVVGRIEEMNWENEFDGIWACASLLHIPKAIIRVALDRIRNALVPRGLFYAAVREGEGESVDRDGRFFAYYQRSEFEKAIDTAGLRRTETIMSEGVIADGSGGKWINVFAVKQAIEAYAMKERG